ncbi:MAG: DUF2309 domain-containing protein [Methylococcales bacterium]|nr:DUF2309 domain-containing protein [Methylococcales bacterium]
MSAAFNVNDQRGHIIATLNHLDHVLPGQAPILDFVHHNTLHGYQHLPFEEALAASEALTGICGYLPEDQSRHFYQQGRINDRDLDSAFTHNPSLQAEQIICTLPERVLTRKDIYSIALLFDLQGINTAQLAWQVNGLAALTALQADVPASIRGKFWPDSSATAVRALWESLLSKLAIQHGAEHPEALLDVGLEQVEQWLAEQQESAGAEIARLGLAAETLAELVCQVGDSLTLRGFVLALSGIDVLDWVRPQLGRFCASAMDGGVAAWQLPGRSELGLYAAWRETLNFDANPFLHELPDWQQITSRLPDDAVDAIIEQLTELEIPVMQWAGYLQRLALELPGWSGLVNWRQHHPRYQTANNTNLQLADYLAIRLTLDRLWLNQVCREQWKCEAKLSVLNAYFSKHLTEFTVRHSLYQGGLPEYLAQAAESLAMQADSDRPDRTAWRQLASLIDVWQLSIKAGNNTGCTANNGGWRLFRLCQHLGLNASHVDALDKSVLLAMLNLLDAFTVTERSKVWLYAFELHYRERFFQVMQANHQRGRWAKRELRPDAQIIFCMDDREEGFRRHLEEYNPAIETLGAAGFFGVAMNYRGLDDAKVTPLCPVVVTPAHTVCEIPRPDGEHTLPSHIRGKGFNKRLANWLHHGLRRKLLLSLPLMDVLAPFTLLGLLAKSFFPTIQHRLLESAAQLVSPKVKTQLAYTSSDGATAPATPENPQQGFTDNEQADRVAGFLRNTGLTYGFSELVVLMGHGSISQNNPHLAAYDCGACSGRHGGPNARAFAAMANRPEIRALLATRGILIPTDTWFIGAEHNTCNEAISWYDLADVPAERQDRLQKLQQELAHAQSMSAHERCRRLASAPQQATPKQALAHIVERAADFSQARPELGHATNAAAVVGRRSLTQGAFFDRRVFLISYDPSQDADGKLLEGILLAVGPVGAGINLEYYFSTVNNGQFGCGTKVPHNVTGFFGVMDGTGGDLRTGLPQQMVEIHEAMRLQLLVEAKPAVLGRIYADQADLRELIAGGWLHLSVIDPDSGEIFVFERGLGFVPWLTDADAVAVMASSADCYRGQSLPVPPVLIKQPDKA